MRVGGWRRIIPPPAPGNWGDSVGPFIYFYFS